GAGAAVHGDAGGGGLLLCTAQREGDRLMVRHTPLWLKIVGTHVPMLLIVAFALGPYVWMFMTSVTAETHLQQVGVQLDPGAWTGANYERLFGRTNFLGNMLNSLIVSVGTVAVALVLSVTAAYAFSRFNF